MKTLTRNQAREVAQQADDSRPSHQKHFTDDDVHDAATWFGVKLPLNRGYECRTKSELTALLTGLEVKGTFGKLNVYGEPA